MNKIICYGFENGNIVCIAPETIIKMLDDIFEKDPIRAMGLTVALMGLV